MSCETCMLKGVMVKGEVFPCDILIVGESPGYHEKIQGRVFVGDSGKLLNQMIYTYLKRKRGEVAIINACRCEIDKRLKEKKSILKQVIKPCRKFFVEDIQKVKPKLIICLGEIALMQVFNKSMTISRNRGLLLDNKEFNCKVFATYHPSFILRRGGISDKNPYWVIWQKDWQFLHDYLYKKDKEEFSYEEYIGNNSVFKGKFLAIDCEWDDKENLIIFSMSDGKTTQYVFPNKLNSVLKDKLRLLFKNKILVFASRPADERIMYKHGFDLSRNIKIDIFHLANLINDNLHINLENIAEVFTDKRKIKEISKQVKKKVWLLEKDLLITYNCLDTESTAQAFINLYKEIKKDEKLFNYWKKFTLPVEEMFADTGMRGFKINKEKLEENLAFVEKKYLELEMELISEIPAKILEKHKDKGLRLSRPDLVVDYLFASRYGLRLKPTIMTNTGKPSTAEEHLVQFSNKKWVDKYLTWKKIGKLYNTFLKGIQKNMKSDGKIYPHFSITTRTGRTACYNPNIQQVPRSMPYIEKLKELYEAPDGWLIGTRDLSQSEIRIVAWLAGEKNILNALKKGIDVHRLTASLVLDKPIDQVTKEERQAAKCFHPDVEILTKKGWIKFRDYNGKDEILQAIPIDGTREIKLEWTKPLYFELRKNHTDKLCRLYNESIDIEVTPDHRLLAQRGTGKFYTTTPREFNKCRYYYCAGSIKEGKKVDNNIIRFLVAVQADGSFLLNKNKNKVLKIKFRFRKIKKLRRLLSILNCLNIPYKISLYGKKITYWNVYVDGKAFTLIEDFITLDKTFKWTLLDLHIKNRKTFIEELQYWNGIKIRKIIVYTTTNRQNAEIIQAVASITGYKSSLSIENYPEENWNTLYRISIKDRPYSRGGNISYSEREYTQEVAVLTVPSSYVLVRSNGKTLIIGQCLNFGLIYGATASTFRDYAYREYGVNLTLEEAEKFRNKFFEAYPSLPFYHRRCVSIVRKFKQIRSPLGRVRRLPYIDSDDYAMVSKAERQAINFPVQSFSSDLALIAMYLFWKEVRNKKSVQVLWFIHDSIFFMCREDVFDKYMALLKECMEERAVEYIRKNFKVRVGYPVESDGKFGKNWACLKDYTNPK